jgi:hypothetical protein
MKQILLAACLLGSLNIHAQEKRITIDKNARQVNGGNAIPAGTYFLLEGAVPEDVQYVDVKIASGRLNSEPLFADSWKRSPYYNSSMFSIPVDQKLRFGSVYRLHADFYSTLKGEELKQLRQRIVSNLDYYLDARINVRKDEMRLGSKADKMMGELNDIVDNSFVYYTSPHSEKFPGFSDLVRIKLKQIDDVNLKNAQYNVSTADTGMQQLNVLYANELQIALHNIIVSELDNYLAYGVLVKTDELNINNLETERSRGYLPIDIGYGAVAFNTDFSDLQTDQQPYIGIAIPFGNPRFSRFMGNASLSFGIFLKNFKNPDGREVTGPVIDKPSYLALGYRIFEFIKINAGVTAISTEKVSANNITSDNVQLKPYVGISAQIDLSLNFSKRR